MPLAKLNEHVSVVCTGTAGLRRALAHHPGGGFSWAYLGQSIEEFDRAKDCFQGFGQNIDVARHFHQASQDLREQYLAYLFQLGQGQNSLFWWLTSLSYRCPYVSKTFDLICILKVGIDLAKGWREAEPLILVAPDVAVRRSLQRNLTEEGISGHRLIGLHRPNPDRSGLDTLTMLVRRAYFLFREGRRILQARGAVKRAYVPREATTLLMSSVSIRNTGRGKEFHTFFFGDLAYKLRDWGHRVALMPLVLPQVPYKQKVAQLTEAQFPVCVPHRYLTLTDLLGAAIRTIKKPPLQRPIPPLAGMDISPLVEDDLRSHWVSNRAADNLLIAATFRRLADAGSNIDRIIYVYENQPWERAMCWQVRRSMPEAKLVGYQHSRAPRMLLNFYLAPGEGAVVPLPNRVVTVGKHTARMFSIAGYGPGIVQLGGAFQMMPTNGAAPMNSEPPSPAGATVLIAPSMSREEGRELVELAIGMFGEHQGIKVVIKCHPAMPFSSITRTGRLDLPKHVQVSEEPIEALIASSSVMVYTSSTVCLQALRLGLPVVHLLPRFALDLDPLEGSPHARLEAIGPGELLDKVGWLLEHRDEYIASHRQAWIEIVDDMYGPVTEQTYRAFVD